MPSPQEAPTTSGRRIVADQHRRRISTICDAVGRFVWLTGVVGCIAAWLVPRSPLSSPQSGGGIISVTLPMRLE